MVLLSNPLGRMRIKLCFNMYLWMTPRFESLQAPLYERHKLLEAAVDLYEFYHYHDMELNWINERLPIAHSTNCGKSLDVAQNLLQKHKVPPLFKSFIVWLPTALHLSLQTCTTPCTVKASNEYIH